MAKGRQRQGKYYFKNEAEVMLELGLEPTPGSGSGWMHKEDGSNDYVLAQLKSTDKQSYSIKQLDLEKLEYNASVENKLPLFVIQFLNKNTRYALLAIEDIPLMAEYIKTGEVSEEALEVPIKLDDVSSPKLKPKVKAIKSSKSSRDSFYKQKEKEWEQRKWKQ